VSRPWEKIIEQSHFFSLYLTGRESGEDLDSGLLSLLAEPFDVVAQGNNVVALVVHLGRMGQGNGVVLGEELHLIAEGGLVQRCLNKPREIERFSNTVLVESTDRSSLQ